MLLLSLKNIAVIPLIGLSEKPEPALAITNTKLHKMANKEYLKVCKNGRELPDNTKKIRTMAQRSAKKTVGSTGPVNSLVRSFSTKTAIKELIASISNLHRVNVNTSNPCFGTTLALQQPAKLEKRIALQAHAAITAKLRAAK